LQNTKTTCQKRINQQVNQLLTRMVSPPSVSSSNGTLDVTLTLEAAKHVVGDIEFQSYLLNGTLPGPTLRIQAGDTMRVLFKNTLAPEPNSVREHNVYGYVDESNLHWHGLHVTSELPSDDVTFVVGPGEEFQYVTTLPAHHMPGTHWVHPHRHGSSSLQVGGGAALALIVEDPPNSLPAQVEGAEEVLMFVQDLALGELDRIATQSGDTQVWSTPAGDSPDLMLVNGEQAPTFEAKAGEWQRWRVIFAGWRIGALNLAVEGCEMQLLAKDGIYIFDFPRTITNAAIPAGGRADIMVRCPSPSSTSRVTSDGDVIATVKTSAELVESSDLEQWTPTMPDYLQDLRETPVTEGCSCETEVGAEGINGIAFAEDNVLHESFLGAVVERLLDSGPHPYHQHLYPYQLVDGVTDTSNYFKLGDWHDTFMSDGLAQRLVTLRYKTTHITGTMMLHCHRLDHEDQGSMAFETVLPAGSPCSCNNGGLGVGVIAGIAAGCVVAVVLAVVGVQRYRKSKKKVHNAAG